MGRERVKLSDSIFDLTGEKDEGYGIPKILYSSDEIHS